MKKRMTTMIKFLLTGLLAFSAACGVALGLIGFCWALAIIGENYGAGAVVFSLFTLVMTAVFWGALSNEE